MGLKSILPKTAPRSQALIRIYGSYCRLNMRAATVLGIQDGDYVNIFYDEQQLAAGRLRIYIGKSSAGIMARKDGHCLVLNSRPLAHKLSALLESEGSYRICPEDSVELNGNTYYNIFFKVYDKENSIKGN